MEINGGRRNKAGFIRGSPASRLAVSGSGGMQHAGAGKYHSRLQQTLSAQRHGAANAT
jgi:hypothetical protein